MNILKFLLIYLFISQQVISNDNLTLFVWQPDSIKPYKGICYEIDKETGGQKFIVSTSKSNCRPEQVKFLWVQNENKVGGRCYMVDAETSGQKYSRTSFVDKCLPQNINYTWEISEKGKGHCFAIDVETGGSAFLIKAKPSKCKTEKNINKWIPNRINPYRGKCYSLDQLTMGQQYQEIVSDQNCRPNETKFEWVQKDQFSNGKCYEIDKIAKFLPIYL